MSFFGRREFRRMDGQTSPGWKSRGPGLIGTILFIADADARERANEASRETRVEFVAKPTDGRRSAHKPKETTK